MKKWFLLISICVSLIVAFFIGSMNRGVNLNNIIDWDMDVYGNVYALTSETAQDKVFYMCKIDPQGDLLCKETLETSQVSGENTEYVQIDLTDEGNICCIAYDLVDLGEKKEYRKEKVLLYDNSAKFLRELMRVESETESMPNLPYIRSINVVKNDVNVFTCSGNAWWSYRTIDTTSSVISDTKLSFFTKYEDDVGVCDVILPLSDGRIAYFSGNNKLYIMNDLSSKNFTNVCEGYTFFVKDAFVDSVDNIYFLDAQTNNVFCYNPSNKKLTVVSECDDKINNSKTLSFGDVAETKVIVEGNIKSFALRVFAEDKFLKYGVDTGETTSEITSVQYRIFPDRLFVIAIVFVFLMLVFIASAIIRSMLKKRFPITVKIILLFLPVFVVATVIIFIVTYFSTITTYEKSMYKNEQLCAETMSLLLEKYGLEIEMSGTNREKIADISFSCMQEGKTSIAYQNDDATTVVSDFMVITVDTDGQAYVVNTLIPPQSQEDYGIFELEEKFLRPTGSELLLAIYSDCLTEEQGEEIDPSRTRFIDTSYGQVILASAPVYFDATKKTFATVTNAMLVRNDEVTEKALRVLIPAFIVLILFIAIYLLFTLKYTFKSLDILQDAVMDLGKDGDWNMKVEVNTNDEIGDLSSAFNLMTENINRYLSSVILLNRTSLRFLPKDLFQLMGKQKITDVNLYDHSEKICYCMFVSFGFLGVEDRGQKSAFKYTFDLMNTNFNLFYKIISENNGVIEGYKVSELRVIFPKSPMDAINAGLQLRTMMANSGESDWSNAVIMVGTGKTFVGVSGNETRTFITALAETFSLGESILKSGKMRKLGVGFCTTSEMIELSKSKEGLKYRHIGRIKSMYPGKFLEIYQIIDEFDTHGRELFIQTKQLFEFAVKNYIEGDINNANKAFSNVLAVNEKDKVAMYYLSITTGVDSINKDTWDGTIF